MNDPKPATPTAWTLRNGGVVIENSKTDKIRVINTEGKHLEIPEAIDLFSRALLQLGGTLSGGSATEEVALALARHEAHERRVVQNDFADMAKRIGSLEAENAALKHALGMK